MIKLKIEEEASTRLVDASKPLLLVLVRVIVIGLPRIVAFPTPDPKPDSPGAAPERQTPNPKPHPTCFRNIDAV